MTTPDPVTDVWELLWTTAVDYRDANPQPHNSTARLIDALMPIVRQYAAGEIERIADEWTWETMHDNEVVSTSDLRREAARLRGELEPVNYDFPPDEADR